MWQSYHKENWAPKNWCFWTVMSKKTLESPLDCEAIQPVSPKGNQSCIIIGRTDAEDETLILWPPDVKSQLMRKDPNAGKDWRQEEKGMIQDEMVGWHHRVTGLLSDVQRLYLWFPFFVTHITYDPKWCGFSSWVGKIPWRRKWQPTPVFLPG